jgi:hypothetical protein
VKKGKTNKMRKSRNTEEQNRVEEAGVDDPYAEQDEELLLRQTKDILSMDRKDSKKARKKVSERVSLLWMANPFTE